MPADAKARRIAALAARVIELKALARPLLAHLERYEGYYRVGRAQC